MCQGKLDVILDPNTQLRWNSYLKDSDRFWQCPDGRHFFHYDYPQLVADEIIARADGPNGIKAMANAAKASESAVPEKKMFFAAAK